LRNLESRKREDALIKCDSEGDLKRKAGRQASRLQGRASLAATWREQQGGKMKWSRQLTMVHQAHRQYAASWWLAAG
jgi:hypothetical protein